jgi:hypothetical protein
MDEMEASYLVTGHTHNNVDQTLGSYSTIRDKQTFISTPVALKYLLQNHQGKGDKPPIYTVISLLLVCSTEYDPPVVFEKIELIWDLASLTPLMNKKIKYFQVPHVTKFKRYPLTGKCYMQYKIFSDREWMPPLPKTTEAQSCEITEIELEAQMHVGGKKRFYERCVGGDQPYNMDESQHKKLEGYRYLLQKGVFDVLQERIINQDIQQATADELGHQSIPLESIEADIRNTLATAEKEVKDEATKAEKDGGGLILWWKGHSFEILSALKVRTVVKHHFASTVSSDFKISGASDHSWSQ